jgi:hypothetical protein
MPPSRAWSTAAFTSALVKQRTIRSGVRSSLMFHRPRAPSKPTSLAPNTSPVTESRSPESTRWSHRRQTDTATTYQQRARALARDPTIFIQSGPKCLFTMAFRANWSPPAGDDVALRSASRKLRPVRENQAAFQLAWASDECQCINHCKGETRCRTPKGNRRRAGVKAGKDSATDPTDGTTARWPG